MENKKKLPNLTQPPEQTEWLPHPEASIIASTLSVKKVPSAQCCGGVFLQPSQAESRPVLYSAGSRKTAKRNFIIMLSTWHIIGAQ